MLLYKQEFITLVQVTSLEKRRHRSALFYDSTIKLIMATEVYYSKLCPGKVGGILVAKETTSELAGMQCMAGSDVELRTSTT